MFIELYKPKVLPLYAVGNLGSGQTARYKLRTMETGAPGRLALNLTFDTQDEAIAYCEELLRIAKGGVKEQGVIE